MSSADDGPAAGTSGARGRRANVRAGTAMFVPIVVFDIAGPIIVQSVARSHGASITLALALSGIPPAVWIAARMLWRGRVDAVGVFVLSSIILATLIGLATGSGRLYLLDGAILTGVFGLVCLASLAAARPLMFHFALESQGGAESPKGREFADLWRYAAFRRVFVVMTVGWGVAYVVGGHQRDDHRGHLHRQGVRDQQDPALPLPRRARSMDRFLRVAGQAARGGAARGGTCGLGVTNTHGDARQNSALGYP